MQTVRVWADLVRTSDRNVERGRNEVAPWHCTHMPTMRCELGLLHNTHIVRSDDGLEHGHVVHFAVLHQIVARLHAAGVHGVAILQPLQPNGAI